MSKAAQCPSTIGSESAAPRARELARSASTGRAYWRGLEELEDSAEFRERLEREFPAFASELKGESRRDFMKLMAASAALAGVAALPGCRRPDHRIMPYSKDPEDVIHGKPTYYATAMLLPGGGAEGLLVETHEGRPTKVEGNPLHPVSRGKTSAIAQASVLDLYDPDRLVGVSRQSGDSRRPATWAEFTEFARGHFGKFDSNGGEGLAFLVEKVTSPSRDSIKARVLKKWPRAKWLPYEAFDDANALEGARIAFGSPRREVVSLEKAKRILAIDRDVLGAFGDWGTLPAARGFAAGRRVRRHDVSAEEMSRVYSVEAGMSLTGGAADHRLRLKPSQIGPCLGAVAAAVSSRLGGAGALAGAREAFSGAVEQIGVDQAWIDAVAQDLVDHRGACVVLAGPAQPPAVHALAMALNSALGAIGQTVQYAPVAEDIAASSMESLRQAIDGGVDTLVVIGCNPVFDAPGDLDFANRYGRIGTTIHLGVDENETAAASTWRLNRAHYLESWGDATAEDGTHSVIQPMIAPVSYPKGGIEEGRSDLELLALLCRDESQTGYEIVRRAWRELTGEADAAFEKTWRRALHDGLLAGPTGSALRRASGNVDSAAAVRAAQALTAAAANGLEVVFRPCPKVWDGRYANNGWLQELPDPISKVTWDNPALISPALAARENLTDGQMITLSVNGRSAQVPVFRQPGMADGVIALTHGYGRTHGGLVAEGVGFNVNGLRGSDSPRMATGGAIARESKVIEVACVQTHWAMEGRPILRDADLAAFNRHGAHPLETHDAYGRPLSLTFGDRLGTEGHAPANVTAYLDWQKHHFDTRPQWGMSIDLTTCSGCGACTVACQAENNIPIVGKSQVLKGREMHWIRVDRYYASATEPSTGLSGDFGTAGPFTGGRTGEDVEMSVMPVPCMHCENAPCETVCPVNATQHGPEGLNEMAYNRCIGTRYCSNNCPYKVRRFNYFDFATKKYKGDVKILPEALVPEDRNLVPPRLRERIDDGKNELRVMQYNPDVTVRERGVMEKCTYCVQRINEARVETKVMGLDHIPDGFMQTACQQACPTESIVFGDILDPLSKVRQDRDNMLRYSLLGYLNTLPRTVYLTRLRNPNPALRAPVEDPFHHGHEDDGHHGEPGHGDEHGSHADGGESADKIMSLPVLPSRRAAVADAARGLLSVGGLS